MLGRLIALITPRATSSFPPPVSYRDMTTTSGLKEIAIFASGCFWGTEHIFLKHFPREPAPGKGIIATAVGYTGGSPLIKNPTYETVCSGRTDHAEALRIEFDPSIVEYAELVEFFYRSHDPTTVNRQGGDVGTQYRSAIFTTTPEQATIAQRVTEQVQAKHFTPKGTKIVTEILAAGPWWNAEDYHQLYLFKNPGGYQCPTHRLHW
ncbi:peptide methionine sulfoxide reductase [Mycena latifolia]|nr:peptide methionine sulfoxide reductase [Mycena latifolia]